MGHTHSIYDTDHHFSIDPLTRAITTTSKKVTLTQGDHNSERFTFELPRYIEGHDMRQCDKVQVHYINIDQATRAESSDLYEVTDLDVSPEDENVVIFSWLIHGNATKYAGPLNFAVRFMCMDGTRMEYAWGTSIHTGVNISNGINNTESVVSDFSDILQTWWDRLYANASMRIEVLTVEEFTELSENDKLENDTLYLLSNDPLFGEVGKIQEGLGAVWTAVNQNKADIVERVKKTDVQGIAQGGTGATNVEEARRNLEVSHIDNTYILGTIGSLDLGTDLNYYDRPSRCGIYGLSWNKNNEDAYKNLPTDVVDSNGNILWECMGKLIVETDYHSDGSGKNVIQTLLLYDAYKAHSMRIYARCCSNGSFHAWQRILTGVADISQGGTGATTAAAARANLGAAPTSHKHSADDISTGKLPVERGGTGLSELYENAVIVGNGTSSPKRIYSTQGAFFSLGNNQEPKFGTLPLTLGGTGVTSAEALRGVLKVRGYQRLFSGTKAFDTSEVNVELSNAGEDDTFEVRIQGYPHITFKNSFSAPLYASLSSPTVMMGSVFVSATDKKTYLKLTTTGGSATLTAVYKVIE